MATQPVCECMTSQHRGVTYVGEPPTPHHVITRRMIEKQRNNVHKNQLKPNRTPVSTTCVRPGWRCFQPPDHRGPGGPPAPHRLHHHHCCCCCLPCPCLAPCWRHQHHRPSWGAAGGGAWCAAGQQRDCLWRFTQRE